MSAVLKDKTYDQKHVDKILDKLDRAVMGKAKCIAGGDYSTADMFSDKIDDIQKEHDFYKQEYGL